jgi:formylglycine-generating enzyme required for sulfatase activity
MPQRTRKAGGASAASAPFISFDFQDDETVALVEQARNLEKAEGRPLNLGQPNGDAEPGLIRIWDNVKKGIDDARCAVAFLDTANANVAFEAGYALAIGKPLVLAKRGRTPDWIRNSLLRNVKLHTVANATSLSRLIANLKKKTLPVPQVDDCSCEGLWLCPRGSGDPYNNAKPADWLSVDGSESWERSLGAVECLAARHSTAVKWIIPPHYDGRDARDAVGTTSCAFIAGYLHGRGVLQFRDIHRHVATRLLADSSNERAFEDYVDLRAQIQKGIYRDHSTVGRWHNHVVRHWWEDELEEHQSNDCLRINTHDGRRLMTEMHPWGDFAGSETETEVQYDSDNWIRQSWDEFAESLLKIDGQTSTRPRCILAADAGVGKTASLKWLWQRLCAVPDCLPVYVKASSLLSGATDVPGVASNLVALVERGCGSARRTDCKAEVLQALDEGMLFLLIDGLDQLAPGESVDVLRALLDSSKCGCIVAGRRYAIRDLAKPLRLATREWSLARVVEFDDALVKNYLGIERASIFERLPANVQRLLRVPRVLSLFKLLAPDKCKQVRTSCDVFARATDQLLKQGLDEAPDSGPGIAIKHQPGERRDYIKCLLARLAFLQLAECEQDVKKAAQRDSTKVPNFHELTIGPEVVKALRPVQEYFKAAGEVDESELENVFRLAWALEHPHDDSTGEITNEAKAIEWRNKSFLEFFAAVWLSQYASADESLRFREWAYYHGRLDAELYYDVNNFLSEMPANKGFCDPLVWLGSARAWYEPLAARPSKPLRASEMIFRSWRAIHGFAAQSYVDWWDKSYDDVAKGRAVIFPMASTQKEPVIELARNILDAFSGELQSILDGKTPQGILAREFIAGQQWKAVNSGAFGMGYPLEDQGFPRKTLAFWEETLASVAGRRGDGKRCRKVKDLRRLSEEINDPDWFTGKLGVRLRKEDVDWLHGVFLELRKATEEGNYDEGIKTALEGKDGIEQRWRRKDENVRAGETPQRVAKFAMHRFPLQHRWYRLFEPGHEHLIKAFLEKRRLPPEDHPAIYVSWYSAWAFCQWARWSDADGQHWLRLPHEPEWEYAARHRRDGTVAPKGQRYWWGERFYKNEKSGAKEDISNAYAHALGTGRKGSTAASTKRIDRRTKKLVRVAANGCGLVDILGNVWEWCANSYNGNKVGECSRYSRFDANGELDADGKLWDGSQRAMRGGTWYVLNLLARCSHRFRQPPFDCDYKMGLRPVRETVPPAKSAKRKRR